MLQFVSTLLSLHSLDFVMAAAAVANDVSLDLDYGSQGNYNRERWERDRQQDAIWFKKTV